MNDHPIPPGAARDCLQAALAALDIPHGATVADQCIRDQILIERAGHAVAMLKSVLADRSGQPDTAWSVGYLYNRLNDHSATGYRTWAERMAELDAS